MSESSWKKLKNDCENCKRCGLRKACTQVVLGHGPKNAKVMFVGEAPGKDEDKEGTPFVGKAGELLNELLNKVGLSREDIYITNIVKCRPKKISPKETESNRTPTKEEQNICIQFVKQEIELLRPKIIVCLGRIAAFQLIDKKFKVTDQHGQFIKKDNILIMGTYHPGRILRDKKIMQFANADFKLLSKKIKGI